MLENREFYHMQILPVGFIYIQRSIKLVLSRAFHSFSNSLVLSKELRNCIIQYFFRLILVYLALYNSVEDGT